MTKPRSIFLLSEPSFHRIYSDRSIREIQELTDNDGTVYSEGMILASPELFSEVEIIFSGWGCPCMDAELLLALPQVKALFYGAGSVRRLVSEAFWQRDIRLTSAFTTNAIPVAEYTVAAVVFSLKQAWTLNRMMRAGDGDRSSVRIPGVYEGSKVGVISLGAIGQLVCSRLSSMQVDVLAYDPFASDDLFAECSAQKVPTLEALFTDCDVVTLHAPSLPETEKMITGDLLRLMPEGASFINTSRGAIVDEVGMLQVLKERTDLFAVIDVITDEPDYSQSPFASLPNAFLTPHIAGSAGRECHRMGQRAVDECRLYLNGEPAITPVTQQSIEKMA